MTTEAYLIRHGETTWSAAGRHTGLTDLALTPRGEEQARAMGRHLAGVGFSQVFVSPLRRAQRTCELAGLSDLAQADPDLVERDYGAYEGRTLAEIRARVPGWDALRDDCPGGESQEEFVDRADRVVERLRDVGGRVAVCSHGHFLRAVALRWIGLPVSEGNRFLLHPASLSVLACDHGDLDAPAISLWNLVPH